LEAFAPIHQTEVKIGTASGKVIPLIGYIGTPGHQFNIFFKKQRRERRGRREEREGVERERWREEGMNYLSTEQKALKPLLSHRILDGSDIIAQPSMFDPVHM
jgi:hypothetical protein